MSNHLDKAEIFVDAKGPGLPTTYKVDRANRLVWVQKKVQRTGTVYYQRISSAPRIRKVLNRHADAMRSLSGCQGE